MCRSQVVLAMMTLIFVHKHHFHRYDAKRAMLTRKHINKTVI